ncbi:MAG: AMP-binding protein [Burkholderiales bacterium]
MAAVAAIGHDNAGDAVAYRAGQCISAVDFVGEVEHVAQQLPDRRYVVNLCTDRCRFAVAMIAALVRGQVSLLPPNQTPDTLKQLQRHYRDLYVLSDSTQQPQVFESLTYPEPQKRPSTRHFKIPAFPESQIAAIAFTSGSTGTPAPYPKSWGALSRGAAAELERFGLDRGSRVALVGTVPGQHMFGLESTVIMALRGGLAMHAGRPFYPADIAAALTQIPGDRVLVTTPVHLRALVAEEMSLPKLRQIICATAPLSPQLAAQVEERYGVPLHEVYGFTEAGMVATRRTVSGVTWQCLKDVRLCRSADSRVTVTGGHVENEVTFSDLIQPQGNHAFILHGRNADLVNIAGKRTSLGHLDYQLNSIPGVQDAMFFMPDEQGEGVTRLMAFVVAPGVTRDALLGALRERIDAVFLPRPLYFVDALPRNATGKVPQADLLRFARDCAQAATRKKEQVG